MLHSMYAPLQSVLVRRPDEAFGAADPARWHYADQPYLPLAQQEHDALVNTLLGAGVEVVYHDAPLPDHADATAARLGLGEQANQLFIRLGPLTPWRELSSLAPGPWPLEPTRAEVETTVTAVTDWLEHEDVVVARAGIPEPGVHLMQGNVDTGLLMVGILGGLTLLLSAFLVANVVGAVIAQQTAQIGVLKALGGRRGLVLRLYGRLVLIFGGLALLLAVPLGLVGAWFMSSTLAAQLNYDIPSFGLTAGTLLVQAAGALLVPLLAALGPVLAAARLPVRDALAGEKSSRKGAKGPRRMNN